MEHGFRHQTIGNGEVLTAGVLEGAGGVRHLFTTRRGGVSRGECESMNFSFTRTDPREVVLENFRIAASWLGGRPEDVVCTRQTHSARVRAVDGAAAGDGVLRPCPYDYDALITATPGLVLGVFVADCVPILLFDPARRAAGAVHAGWRGTAQGIAAAAVAAMEKEYGTDPRALLAAIGPSIGPCCFETGPEVPEMMRAALPDAGRYFAPRGEKYFGDLWQINRQILLRAGLLPDNIGIAGECTRCDTARYFSHRAMGERRGNMGAFIRLVEREDG